MTQPERRLLTILAADVVGFSRLAERDEARTLEALKRLLKEAIEPAVADHSGRIVKLMGDGVLAAFESVVDAVRCAITIQQETTRRQGDTAADERLALRIGINLGDAVIDGDDLFGDAVNIAARLEQIAEPGGIAVSGTAYDHLAGKLEEPLAFIGEQQLKNVERPIRVYRVDWDKRPPVPVASRLRIPRPWSALAAASLLLVGALAAAVFWFTASEPSLAARPSIAVLPFDSLGGGAAAERLAAGITEDVITDLARFREFDVIARNSTAVYQGRPTDIREIAEHLDVQYVLEGSIQQIDDRLRATAQLIDGESGNHVWSERWDRSLDDFFAVQSEIAERVASRIGGGGVVARAEQARAKRRRPTDLSAYGLYLLAQEEAAKATRESNRRALDLLQRAVDRDPLMARAWVLLALQHDLSMSFGAPSERAGAAALEAAERAVDLDPMDAEAHAALGNILASRGDVERAAAAFETALRLNPGHIEALTFYAGWAAAFGDPEAGAAAADRARRLNPSYPPWAANMFRYAYFMVGRYADAIQVSERQPAENRSTISNIMMAAAYGALGRKAEAKRLVAELVAADPTLNIESFVSDPFWTAAERPRLRETMASAGFPPCAPASDRDDLLEVARIEDCEAAAGAAN